MSRRHLSASRCAVASLLALAGTLSAAEPAPVAELRLADGPALMLQWAGTPVGRTWQDPVAEPLRQAFDQWQQTVAKDLGGTPVELLEAMSRAAVVAQPGAKPDEPQVIAGAEFGRFAEKLFSLMAENPKAQAATVPGATAAVSFGEGAQRIVAARIATALAAAWNATPAVPTAPATPLTDAAVAHVNITQLFDLIEAYVKAQPEPNAAMLKQVADMKRQFLAQGMDSMTFRMQFLREGVTERFSGPIKQPILGYKPVDRALLGRLPATASLAMAVGYDLSEVWAQQKAELLASWAPMVGTDPTDAVATQHALDERIGAFIPGVTLEDAVNGLKGTTVFAIGQGVPFPTTTLVLPRSKALDGAIAQGLAMLGQQPPAEGASALIPIPNAPVALTLVCEKTTWMATTDTAFGDAWLTGKPNGWLDTPAAKLAIEKAPADAYLIGASDTPSVLRTITGYIGMGLGMAKNIDAKQKQSILGSLGKLAENSSTGYIVGGSTDKGTMALTEMRSVTGVMPFFMSMGIAAPIMAQRRAEAFAARGGNPGDRRGGPAATLRDTVFPAQVQFQAGAYIDQDGDGTGEYGLLSEISGRRPTGSGSAELLEGALARGASAGGYSYTVYLPGGKDRVSDDGKKEPRAAVAADADAQEQRFVVYAWPTREKQGQMYALMPDGQVYQSSYTGVPPAWNAVFAGKTWTDAPAWTVVDGDDDGVPAGATTGAAADAPAPAPVDVP